MIKLGSKREIYASSHWIGRQKRVIYIQSRWIGLFSLLLTGLKLPFSLLKKFVDYLYLKNQMRIVGMEKKQWIFVIPFWILPEIRPKYTWSHVLRIPWINLFGPRRLNVRLLMNILQRQSG